MRQPLEFDKRYVGPCPKTFRELESSNYEWHKLALAKAHIRSSFWLINATNYTHSYKFDETKIEIEKFVERHPDNLVALTYLQSFLDTDDDIIKDLDIETKMLRLDIDCVWQWPLRLNNISSGVYRLVNNRLAGKKPGADISDQEFYRILKESWDSIILLHDHIFSTSTNIRKLTYAVHSLDHPMLFRNAESLEVIVDYLGIDPEQYRIKRVNHLQAALKKEFSLDNRYDQSYVLGMMCSYYSYEIGLISHCFDLIKHYIDSGRLAQQDLRAPPKTPFSDPILSDST